jgi:hypothetical protein
MSTGSTVAVPKKAAAADNPAPLDAALPNVVPPVRPAGQVRVSKKNMVRINKQWLEDHAADLAAAAARRKAAAEAKAAEKK